MAIKLYKENGLYYFQNRVHPAGTCFLFIEPDGKLTVKNIANGEYIITQAAVTDFIDALGAPYATLNAFLLAVGDFFTTNNNSVLPTEISIKDSLGFPLTSDAFGRLRVSEPYTVFDNSLTSPASDALFWSTLVNGTGAGTHDRATAKYTLTAPATGDYIVRQTKIRFKYQPGKSHLIFLTGLLKSEASYIKRLGYADHDNVGLATINSTVQNGIFFENYAGVLSWNIANNGVISEKVLQTNWNIDKFDGTGASGLILNTDSTLILAVDLEWLGVGSVLVGTQINRRFYPMHIFNHANVGFTDVYMRTANLPIFYSLINAGGANGSLKQICSTVISEGGFNPSGIIRSVDTGITAVAISSNVTELMVGIRLLEDSFEYTVEAMFISIAALANADGRYILSLNPTYSGSVTWNALINSNVEVAINNNNVVSDEGIVLVSGFFSANADTLNEAINTSLRIGKSLANVRDELWLSVTAIGSSETFSGGITFKDLL